MSPPPTVENEAEALRELLLAIYVSGALLPDRGDLPESEAARLLDTVLDAAEGRPFTPLGLPFPRPEAS